MIMRIWVFLAFCGTIRAQQDSGSHDDSADIRAQLEAAHSSARTAFAERDSARTEADNARRDLASAQQTLEAAQSARQAESDAANDLVRSAIAERDVARTEVGTVVAERDLARTDAGKAEQELTSAQALMRSVVAERDASRAEVQAATAQVATVVAERDLARTEASKAETELKSAKQAGDSESSAAQTQMKLAVAERDTALAESKAGKAQAKKELEAAKAEAKEELDAAKKELDTAKAQTKKELEAANAGLKAAVAEKEAASTLATTTKGSLDSSQAAHTKKDDELKAHRAEAEKVKAQLQFAKDAVADADTISISNDLLTLAKVSQGAFQHLLSQTDLDDRAMAAASKHLETAKAFASRHADQVASVDYKGKTQEMVSLITSHPVYVAHVAPKLSMIAPHFEAAKKKAEPHLNVARVVVIFDSAKGLLPALTQRGRGALNTVSSKASEHLEPLKRKAEGLILDPLFQTIARAAPEHSKALPKNTFDRILLLVVALVVALVLVKIFLRLYRIVLRLAIFTARMIFKFCVVFPLALVSWILGLCLCISTGFYCCGLCRTKKPKVEKLAAKAGTKGGKNAADAPAAVPAAVPAATVEDLITMLEAAKKKGKLEAGAKQLVTAAQKGKPVTIPQDNKSKSVSIDTLKKAIAHFKELQGKKLGI